MESKESRGCANPIGREVAMKIDVFNHIFPKAYFDRMVRLAPTAKICTSG
jgi:hypothetical protein